MVPFWNSPIQPPLATSGPPAVSSSSAVGKPSAPPAPPCAVYTFRISPWTRCAPVEGELKMVPLAKACTVPSPTFSGCPLGAPSFASPPALV
ncbi:Uncharacterised protein [Mycobacteroides abscessus subsp. abscessus]|nr:Uncharacterised protein [Mycobacteroides abscessus subsp. abscessus]